MMADRVGTRRGRVREEFLGETHLSWMTIRGEMADTLTKWKVDWRFTFEQMAAWLSTPPYQEREKGLSTRYVGSLFNGQLKRGPHSWELLAIFCIMGHLFDPVTIKWGKVLGYTLEPPRDTGLREEYEYLCNTFRQPDARAEEIARFFRRLKKVMMR